MLGKMEGRWRRGQQRMRWMDGITDPMDMSWSRFWETVKHREACVLCPWCHKESHSTVEPNNNMKNRHKRVSQAK